jgi:2-polyprenyl-3-methyl-5-hydroxy-6-metoxy-1,4-benzoquinol methylase
MDCCQCDLIETQFDRETVAKKVERYRKQGLKKETEILVDALLAEGVEGRSLLDVGGGLGALEFELLKAGSSRATNVEASSAYIEAAQAESLRQGCAERVSHIHGDFVAIANDVPPADVVTLDKVICCYDDMVSLVSSSVQKANKLYGVIYPRDTWWVKAAIAVENLIRKLKGNSFRVIVHPTRAVDQLIRDSGMEKRFYRALIDWQIVVYARAEETELPS